MNSILAPKDGWNSVLAPDGAKSHAANFQKKRCQDKVGSFCALEQRQKNKGLPKYLQAHS